MARKPTLPVSYGDDVALPGVSVGAIASAGDVKSENSATSDIGESRGGRRPILDKSAPTIVYVHPAGKHQLRSYAVAQGLKVKVHDLMLEALEEWGEKRGLAGPWRVPSSRSKP